LNAAANHGYILHNGVGTIGGSINGTNETYGMALDLGRFLGVLVSPFGFSLPVRMMANHSEEFPEGSLTKQQLMFFFSITGESGNFQYNPSYERIPDNRYQRVIGGDYSIPGFLADVLNFGRKYPPSLGVAGNTGKTDSLTPVDLGSLTKDVFNAGDLLQGKNLECFLLQVSQAALPISLVVGATLVI
jgi:hypothetical protein